MVTAGVEAVASPASPTVPPVDLARALAEPLRWRIVELLSTEQLCVAHLSEELGAAQPLVSHHLKVLRQAGLIEPDRYRYWTYYRLRPGALVRLAATLGLFARSSPSGTACRRLIPGVDPVPPTPARPPARQGGPVMPDGQLDPTNRATFARSIEALHEEFRGIYSLQTIERFVDESIDRLSGARVVDFIPLFVHRFSRERLRAFAQAEGAILKDVPEVLFVCVHNAGRSQMAAALLDHHAKGKVHVRSAGSAPADRINPAVAAATDEWGIDLSQEFPKPSPMTSSRRPMWSSPWAAEMPAPSTRASATWIGSWTTPPVSRSRWSAASATTSTPASSSCSAS
jgi:DNA-binding transcriptional ArsR family regulator